MTKILNAPKVLFFISTFVLWLNFSGHTLSTLSLDKFLEGEFESERYVVSRLVYNLDHGPEAQGGFMLRYEAVDGLRKSVNRDDYTTFKAEKSDDAIDPYYSHAGLQDDVLWPLWIGLQKVKALVVSKARPNSRWHQRMETLDIYYFVLISQGLVALVNALVLSLFVLWVAREYKTGAGWGTLLFIILAMPVLTYFGRSMWWMMWAWYLPFLIVLWGVHVRQNIGIWGAFVLGILSAATIALKTTMGYEYVSTIMMGVLIPPAYYAVKNGWSWPRWMIVSGIIGVCGLSGFIAGFSYHWYALQDFGLDPYGTIMQRFSMRAHGGFGDLHGEMAESVRASFWGVTGGYIISPKELMPPQVLLMAPFFWMVWRRCHTCTLFEDRTFLALSVSVALGFIGAVSMFLILKGHAYIHGFDVVVWSIPMNLFLGTLYARQVYLRYTQSKYID